MDLKQRFELSKQSGTVFVLTPEDIKAGISNNDKEIKTIDDLIMVHVSNYLPIGSIRTPESTKKHQVYDVKYHIGESTYTFQNINYDHRNSVHFCLNASVENHAYRTVLKNKYAVLMPLANNKENIVAGTECDIFSDGDVLLKDDAYILCIESEYTNVKNANPNASIVICKGDSVDPYVNVFLSQVLGYKYKEPTELSKNWDHASGVDHEHVKQIINANGWKYVDHNRSIWDMKNLRDKCTDKLSQTIINIINSKALYSVENMHDVYKIIDDVLSESSIKTGYSFDGDMLNPDSLNYVYQRIINETGIDIKRKTERLDLKLGFDKERNLMATSIVEQLRNLILIKKQQLGMLSYKEQIELLFNQKGMNYYEFFNGINSANKDDIKRKLKQQGLISSEITSEYERTVTNLKQFDYLNNKALDQMSTDELDSLLTVINLKSKLLYGDTLKVIRSNDGRIMMIPSSQVVLSLLFSKVISKEEFVNTISQYKTDGERNNYLQMLFDSFNSHIKVMDDGYEVTDFDSSKCNDVVSFLETIDNYALCFIKLFSGQEIQFDQYGNEEALANNVVR